MAIGRRDIVLAALLAAATAGLVVAVVPPAGDAPAHFYRALLVREGIYVWDNLWYAGHYPLASYSLLYYLPAALVGNAPLVVAATIASAALFASVAIGRWGEAARWPARAFAVLAAGPLVTGTYPYALGVAVLLAALRALQGGRALLGVALAALTLGFSPLAFLFLCLVLVAVFLARPRVTRRSGVVALGIAVLGGLELLLVSAFRTEETYVFPPAQLAALLAVIALGAALSLRAPAARVLGALFLVWGLAAVVAFLVANPVGANLTRVRFLVFPLVLLAALLAGLRPRWLAATALAVALAYNVLPYRTKIPAAVRARSDTPAFWAPAIGFLRERSTPNHRLEVVPTAAHWEAYYLPRAGLPLARGWYRQRDLAENALLYQEHVSPAAYEGWLRARGVRYVLLADLKLDTKGAEAEARLLRSPRSRLRRVLRTRDFAVYELPRPTPLLTGPSAGAIRTLDHDRVAGWTTTPGSFRLRIGHTPYWRVRRGSVCVQRARDGSTVLRVRRAGDFVLTVERPHDVVASVITRGEGAC